MESDQGPAAAGLAQPVWWEMAQTPTKQYGFLKNLGLPIAIFGMAANYDKYSLFRLLRLLVSVPIESKGGKINGPLLVVIFEKERDNTTLSPYGDF